MNNKDESLCNEISEPGHKSKSSGGTGHKKHGPDTSEKNNTDSRFHIVGIGASAGGLDALEKFFSAISGDTDVDMAFVVVQHLSPDHKSMLSDIIGRYTNMQVHEVKDGMAVKPNVVYIIPPASDIIIIDGVLNLVEPVRTRGHSMPIDHFFSSLASDRQELAIGIILSGTANDGTQGVAAIKSRGGMVMAQNPESSEYNGMPKSAIETGLVDYILEPSEMPAQLHEYLSLIATRSPELSINNKKAMDSIFKELLTHTGHDFSNYKPQTLERRIKRRMVVNDIKRLEGYANFLQQKPGEVEALFRDLLISVTSFFRNPGVFEQLRKKVIPKLFEDRSPNTYIRIWIAACSTGEEAYSIAILLQEYMEKLKQNFQIQIFATDIDSRSIEKARKGVYPASAMDNVSTERLKRYFTHDSEDNTYTIHKNIRSMVVFSEHNVINDPPFSNIDLLSCRNMMIYMNKEMQSQLIPLFHYSLNSKGFLFIGSSESISNFSKLFRTVDLKSKIFQKKEDNHLYNVEVQTFFSNGSTPEKSRQLVSKPSRENKLQMRELTERSLLKQYAPAGVLVDERGDILYLHGNTGQYLEMPPGEPVLNILKMAREGLQEDLTKALRRAVVRLETALIAGVRVKTNGDFTTVDLTVRPVQDVVDRKLFLVTFDMSSEAVRSQVLDSIDEKIADMQIENDDETVLALKEELRTTEEYLRSSNEELEISNEELKASNEELQSLNEEFQSTNEELETSREELESLNEELSTVNTELQNKVEELSNVNKEMDDMLASTGIGIIFVDTDLRIQRFTPAATKVINLLPVDTGRPIGHIVTNLRDYDNLTQDIRHVMDKLDSVDKEVHIGSGEWYMLSIKPYQPKDETVEGAVVTFIDISKLKQLQEKQTETLRRLAVVVRDAHDAITLVDTEGNIMAWNPAAEKMYGWSETEALDMNISDMVPEDTANEALSLLEKLSQDKKIQPYRTKRLSKNGDVLEVWVTATILVNESGEIYSIATTERPINKDI